MTAPDQTAHTGRTETGTARYHVLHPSVRSFELFLAKIIGERPCAGCGKPRGYGQPVIALDRRFYHPPCGRSADAARSPAPPFAGYRG